MGQIGGRPGAIGGVARAIGGAIGRRRLPPGMRRHRRHGISAAELRGFNKLSRMLARFGMVPRKMRGARLRKKES